jgi:hypothetical protein
LCDLVAGACGVVPEVEAPEGSGCGCWILGGGVCFGLVPEVDGVGDERGLLVAGEVLVFELGGEAGGGSGGARGVAGAAVLAGVIGVLAGSRGCNLGTVVQLYWNSGTVSSSPVRNL